MKTSPTSPSGAGLLEKARAGDFDAFADLCESCRESTCAYLTGAGLAEPDEAEDVFMDSFLRARRAIASFQGGSSFSTWLCSIARNIALDRKRAAAARPVFSLDASPSGEDSSWEPRLASDGLFPSPFAAPDPSAALDEESRNETVRAALASLPGKTREALVLSPMQDKSYSEIAAILGVPIGTVMSRIHNGRKKLAAMLAPVLGLEEGLP